MRFWYAMRFGLLFKQVVLEVVGVLDIDFVHSSKRVAVWNSRQLGRKRWLRFMLLFDNLGM